MSTTQDVLSRRRPRGASDNDAAVGQRPEATESVAAGMPEAFAGAETVGALHEQLGNDVVAAALDGAELDGLGGLVNGSADADVQAAPIEGGNTAMLSAMRDAIADRDATIDWSNPTLRNLGREGGGRPLPAEQLARFNQAFGHDFSHVRVHVKTNAE